MIVYTYYDPIVPGGRSPAHSGVLRLWSESWRRKGWEPRVLGPRDAKKHPHHARFLRRMREYPTINPREYEDACYLRWLALDKAGGGLMVDYDVINMGFAPRRGKGAIEMLDPTYVPCAVFANSDGIRRICYELEVFNPKGATHVSDMHIFKSRFDEKTFGPPGTECVEFTVEGWASAPLVHFASGKVRGFPSKAAAIQSALNHVGR
jgi:hypothetical protein